MKPVSHDASLELGPADQTADAGAAPRSREQPALTPGREYWQGRPTRAALEYAEVAAVIGAVAVAGWFVPVSHHFFGYVYLFAVIALSLRVGRWPVLFAAVISAVTWNFVFIPPRLSFAVLDFENGVMLGTYFFAALIGGQLTARIRAQEREERQREQRALALLHLSRALAVARTLDEAAAAALRQADELFAAQTALLLPDASGTLRAHAASSFGVDDRERAVAAVAYETGRPAGWGTGQLAGATALHLPLRCAHAVLGVFVVRFPAALAALTNRQWDLIDAFSVQIALLVEREQLRAAGEREKLLAESDRLHRTLLDSVSHELKTPLAVLRSAVEKLETDDVRRRASLTGEIRTATRRLDHLVANLLDQTRLEAGGVRAQLDWCEIRDVVGAARRSVGEALSGRALKVEIADTMPLFLADTVLMEHALANVLLNAGLHTPAGSPVEIVAGLDATGRRVTIAVSDSGPGLAAELRGDLFQKFRRGVGARAGGLGLGLSIVHGFMLAQGGDVIVASSATGGTCFTLRLPFTPHGSIPNDER